MKLNNLIFILFLGILMIGCGSGGNMIDKTTIKELDLNRYLGKWYEIARFPHSFEDGLVGVTATYSLREDGKIKVVNQGYDGSLNGKLKVAVGKAKIPDKSKPANFKVAFFLFFYGEYNVLELDSENYQWAMIGSSTDKYFWILSRTPQMDEKTYSMLLDRAKERGYNLSKLIKVKQ